MLHKPKPECKWTAMLLLATVAQGWGAATVPAGEPELVDGLKALVGRYDDPRRTIALLVAEAPSGRVLFQRHADQPLRPASVMKLFTTAAALQKFGPHFAYETRFYLSADNELWVIGAGDPGLGDERLLERDGKTLEDLLDDWARRIGKAVREEPIRRIVLDDSVFDHEFRNADWPRKQGHKWYLAPIGGLNLNNNCVDSWVDVRGGAATLRLRPPLPSAFIENELRVTQSRSAPIVTRHAGNDLLLFRGPVRRSTRLGPVAVARPTVFFGHALKRALEDRGVEVTGAVVRRRIPVEAVEDVRPLITVRTPLRDCLWRANTFSQNMFAEGLLKSLGAYDASGRRTGIPGSWSAGSAELRRFVREIGIEAEQARFRDGSGLSHENRVTARQVVDLLRAMLLHPHAESFVASLAMPGGEGTLRRYEAGPTDGPQIRAKTGTISGVRTLAGYVLDPGGRQYAFALLAEGGGRGIRKDLCALLLDTIR